MRRCIHRCASSMYILQIYVCAGFLLSGTFWTSTDGSWSPMNAFVHDIYLYISCFSWMALCPCLVFFPSCLKCTLYPGTYGNCTSDLTRYRYTVVLIFIPRLRETSSRFPVNIPGANSQARVPWLRVACSPMWAISLAASSTHPTHAASPLTALNPLSPPYISLSLSLICSSH